MFIENYLRITKVGIKMKIIKKQSTKSNLIFQTIYQMLLWVVPLVISPFLTRRMGADSLGTYTFINSIAYYFVLFANLGVQKYGQRLIAESRDKENLLQYNFWAVFYNHIISAILSLMIYTIFVLVFAKDNIMIYKIEIIYVASSIFDVTWLFYGLENFKGIAIRNAIVKLFVSVAILSLIRTPSDLNIYTWIMALGELISQLVLMPQVIRQIPLVRVKIRDMIHHVKPLLYFSIAVIAVSLYTIFDKTLLGILASKQDVAFYEYADRIVNVPKTLISIIATVLFPKICNLAVSNKNEEAKKYLNISIILTSCLALGAFFGFISISNEFALLYYGNEFVKTGKIMVCMAPLIYIISIGNMIRLQYMIPYHKDRAYIICICLNAVINLVLSTILIPKIGVYGALVGSLSAEIFGLIFQMIYSRKFISPFIFIRSAVPFICIGMVMFGVISGLNIIWKDKLLFLVLKIVIGGSLYIILSLLYIVLFSQEKVFFKEKLFKVLKIRKNIRSI